MYIFNHIPRTGGTSILSLLKQMIGPDLVSPRLDLTEDLSYELEPNDYHQYMVIQGHLGVAWNDTLAPGSQWMTILRDPVDRVLSQYYFWRDQVPPSPHLRHVHLAQTLPLDEFVRLREEKALQGNANVQTWLLADDFRVRYRRLSSGDALELACYNLAQRCAFVGIFEEYEASVGRLCRLFGKSLPNVMPKLNPSGRPPFEEIDPHIVTSIKELNAMDEALYRYAKEITAKAGEPGNLRLAASETHNKTDGSVCV